jgi:rubrerythrin
MIMEETILELYAGLCRETARCGLHALRAVRDNRAEPARVGGRALTTGFDHFVRVRPKNGSLYRRVDRDRRNSGFYVCSFCDCVNRDTAPDNCPDCTAPAKRFVRIGEERV